MKSIEEFQDEVRENMNEVARQTFYNYKKGCRLKKPRNIRRFLRRFKKYKFTPTQRLMMVIGKTILESSVFAAKCIESNDNIIHNYKLKNNG